MDGINSILISIKRMLGIDASYTHFDQSIVININSVLMSLMQFGVGPEGGFIITGENETWAQFLNERKDLEAVKTYIYLKVRLLFDPPTINSVLEAMERQVNEFEWRLSVQAQPIIGQIPEEGV